MRQYKQTAEGERPRWASRAQLERMGKDWARQAVTWDVLPCKTGNIVHDRACAAEYRRLTGLDLGW